METWHTLNSNLNSQLPVTDRLSRDTYNTMDPYRPRTWYFKNNVIARQAKATWAQCGTGPTGQDLPFTSFCARVSTLNAASIPSNTPVTLGQWTVTYYVTFRGTVSFCNTQMEARLKEAEKV